MSQASQPPPEIRLGPQGGPRMLVPIVRPKDTRSTLRRLWGYLRRQHRALLMVVVLVTVATGFSLTIPYLIGLAIDRYIQVGDLPGLGRVVLLMLGIAGCYALVVWWHTILMIRVSQRTVRDLRRDLFAKLQTLPLRFFDQRPHGELMSYLTNDVENISLVLAENVTTFMSSLLIVVGMVIAMLIINVPLALVSIIVLPLTAYFTRYIANHTRQGFREQQEALSVLSGQIEETMTGGRVIRAFGREQAAIEDFDVKNERLRNAAIYAQTYGGLMGPGGNLIYNVGFVLIAASGGWLALHGHATVGIIATFLTYTQQLRRPLNDLSNMFNAIQGALAGAERAFFILDERVELENAPDARPVKQAKGAVVFDEVSFGYRPDVPILKQVSFDIKPGQTIALVGPTGAGKTTIVNLLSRFYDVDSGRILLDGNDLRGVDKHDLRRSLGIVLQDTFLFSETVTENIRYGRLNASDDDVIAAARLANADHFIRHLPHGYQEMLSERAENLSQGQRQLLAIARAILADPSILILDEATSSVDTRTEIQVQEAMRRLMKGRTSFVIAHRLSTIREADLILFIRNGEVVEQGTHDELLAQRKYYYSLYMSQFRVAAISSG
jgi:ATP-binding cassette subfamily B multidrug efflux pump